MFTKFNKFKFCKGAISKNSYLSLNLKSFSYLSKMMFCSESFEQRERNSNLSFKVKEINEINKKYFNNVAKNLFEKLKTMSSSDLQYLNLEFKSKEGNFKTDIISKLMKISFMNENLIKIGKLNEEDIIQQRIFLEYKELIFKSIITYIENENNMAENLINTVDFENYSLILNNLETYFTSRLKNEVIADSNDGMINEQLIENIVSEFIKIAITKISIDRLENLFSTITLKDNKIFINHNIPSYYATLSENKKRTLLFNLLKSTKLEDLKIVNKTSELSLFQYYYNFFKQTLWRFMKIENFVIVIFLYILYDLLYNEDSKFIEIYEFLLDDENINNLRVDEINLSGYYYSSEIQLFKDETNVVSNETLKEKNDAEKKIKRKEKKRKSFDIEIKLASEMTEKLSDIRGIDEIKEEIDELIKMIKSPDVYESNGVKLPKGILLCGKPGTGKTLIARAIAGESKLNFLYLTGSDFDHMFVGSGSKKVKELFEKARKKKPCIIFIDEIDSLLASSRRNGGEHSSSRSTLNKFLAEMDGFNNNKGVYVIGATNHEDSLDQAAIRPGRFDKKIHVPMPDVDGRGDIIKYYLEKVKLNTSTLNSKIISLMTPGFSGADIENLINLSIIMAVNKKKEKLEIEDISECRDRIMLGIARKSFTVPDKRRFKTSLHEAGHALVCYKNDNCRKNLHKLTIIPRGPAEGVVSFLFQTFRLQDDNALGSKEEFLTEIEVALGGHVAEEIFYGKDGISAGCSSDLEKASSTARSMLKNFGMYGELVGYKYVEGTSYSYQEDDLSDEDKKKIDNATEKILKESREKVYNMLLKDSDELKRLAEQCFIHDTLEFEDIDHAIKGRIELIKAQKVRKAYDLKEIGNKIIKF